MGHDRTCDFTARNAHKDYIGTHVGNTRHLQEIRQRRARGQRTCANSEIRWEGEGGQSLTATPRDEKVNHKRGYVQTEDGNYQC